MLQTLKQAIQDELAIEPGEITEDSTINSLGIDSLETVEISMRLEEELEIKIPDNFDMSGERDLRSIAADLEELTNVPH